MPAAATIHLPHRLAEKLRREALEKEMSLEEYVLELLTKNYNTEEKAIAYIETAELLIGNARKESKKDNIHRASEEAWAATLLAVKAYAYWREGRRLASHTLNPAFHSSYKLLYLF